MGIKDRLIGQRSPMNERFSYDVFTETSAGHTPERNCLFHFVPLSGRVSIANVASKSTQLELNQFNTYAVLNQYVRILSDFKNNRGDSEKFFH
jgi:hypothetical protein